MQHFILLFVLAALAVFAAAQECSVVTVTLQPTTGTPGVETVTRTRTRRVVVTKALKTVTSWRARTCPTHTPERTTITATFMATSTVTETLTTIETTTSISTTTSTTTETTTTTATPSCPPKPPVCWYTLPIPDPGFEMPGTAESWLTSDDPSKRISFRPLVDESAHSGRYVLKSVSLLGNTWGGTATKSIILCPGRRYRFTAWTKHLQGGGWARFSINGIEVLSTQDRVGQEGVWMMSGEWWRSPEGRFDAEVKIEVFGREDAHTLVNVDDVELRLGEE